MEIICPKCKGNGYVFNNESLMLTVFLPVAMFIESIDDFHHSDITRKKCPLCKGKKKVRLESN